MKFKGESASRKLFKRGEFRKALLGDDDFLIEDSFWGGHDSTSVWFYILRWLREKDHMDKLSQVKQAVREIFNEPNKVSDIDGILTPIFVVRTYCIAAREEKFLPINPEFIIELLHEYKEKFTEEEMESFNIERDMKELKEEYLPNL
jgi:hypothetical protein